MNELTRHILEGLATTTRDVLPVIVVIAFFQFVYFKKPLHNPRRVLPGLLFVVLGLYLFIEGLSIGLFPLGETMAEQFSQPEHLGWIYAFAFCLAYATCMAEPALIAVSMKAEQITTGAIRRWPLRNAVAVGAACGLTVGVFRIVQGHPLHWYIIACYVTVMVLTRLVPKDIIGLAYDSGGVTTSTVTVPLVTALGLGLAGNLDGRDPLLDGFGLIAFTAMGPLISVMIYATAANWYRERTQRLDRPGVERLP